MIFAMRHIREISFVGCILTDIRSISDQLNVDSLATLKFAIIYSRIISDTHPEIDGTEAIVDTFAMIKKTKSKCKSRMWLNFTCSNRSNKEMEKYIESENLDDVLEILR